MKKEEKKRAEHDLFLIVRVLMHDELSRVYEIRIEMKLHGTIKVSLDQIGRFFMRGSREQARSAPNLSPEKN
jgi:hypothetical protein